MPVTREDNLLTDRSVTRPTTIGTDGAWTADPTTVLAVTSEVPWPLNSGGHLRSYHMLRAISRRFPTRVVVPVRAGEETAVALLREHGLDLCAVPVGRRTPWSEARRVLGAAFRGQPYVMYRRHHHPAVVHALNAELASRPPSVFYSDHLDPLSLLDKCSTSCSVVVDLHNIYSVLLTRTAEERRGMARHYLRREARLLGRVEAAAARQAAALFCVSPGDADHFRSLSPSTVHLVPNGVDCSAYAQLPTGRSTRRPLILFLGAMSWEPNGSAVRFLAREVLPALHTKHPDARLRIVGRDPTAEVKALANLPGVEVTGTVESVLPHLEQASVLAVPLEAGGGTRLKILEAFAAGLPVVSTAVGCEGLGVVHEQHLFVAERDAFAATLGRLITSEALSHEMAARARQLVRDQFDWEAITARACDHVHAVAEQHCRTGSPI